MEEGWRDMGEEEWELGEGGEKGGGAEGTTLAFICGFSLEQQVSLAAGRCECRVFGWL